MNSDIIPTGGNGKEGQPLAASGLLCASRKWRIFPRVSYTNFRKLYPQTQAFKRRFMAQRAWSGLLWIVGIKHHVVKLDWRRNWVRDMFDA